MKFFLYAFFLLGLGAVQTLTYAIGLDINFKSGDQVKIYSDKTFARDGGKTLEVLGNVVIIHRGKKLFGERAIYNKKKNLLHFPKEVRIITPEVELQGNNVEYFIDQEKFKVRQAQLESADYIMSADYLEKTGEKTYLARNISYTTCQLCPRSWSIVGKRAVVVVDRHIKVWGARVKIMGGSVFYLPYFFFPIKQKRQTGFLFPKFSISSVKASSIELPFFWAISPSADMTLTPSFWGERGWGAAAQVRKKWTALSWLEGESFVVNDHIYLPGKTNRASSGERYFRSYGEYEHRWSLSPRLHHHLRFIQGRDTDFLSDFNQKNNNQALSSHWGIEGNFDFNGRWGNLSGHSGWMRPLLSSYVEKQDPHAVQVLPRVQYLSPTFSLLRTPGGRSVSLDFNVLYQRFHQERALNPLVYRSADRVSTRPELKINWGYWGPLKVFSKAYFDYQYYNLHGTDHNFYKYSSGIENTLSLSMHRDFGLAYKKTLKKKGKISAKEGDSTIGKLPNYEETLSEDEELVQRFAYRHKQQFALTQYYTWSENEVGNGAFREQITGDEGLFDERDALRSQHYRYGLTQLRDSIPTYHTYLFEWRQSLIRKRSQKEFFPRNQNYPVNQFRYQQVAELLFSQDYVSRVRGGGVDGPTRFLTDLSLSLAGWNWRLGERYFYLDGSHLFLSDLRKNFSWGHMGVRFEYNTASVSEIQNMLQYSSFRLSRFFQLEYSVQYNFERQKVTDSRYKLRYHAPSNCWKFDLNYSYSPVESRFSFDLYFKFDGKGFRSLKGKS